DLPFNELFITHLGDALPCQILLFASNFNDICLGNIKNKSIHELWNIEKMINLRYGQKHRIPEKMPFCKNCSTC
ncbi:MAG: SPASM domain-containing protein, partial [Bacteroidales bacterium]|nr:SPASM domain-containing protein [Bacteroidales bacterium]